jgi:hypothetical protein
MAKLARRPLPPLEWLGELFEIDESSPSFLRWRIGRKASQVAGYLEADGYWRVKVTFKGQYQRIPVHRIIFAMHNKIDPDNQDVDHIDNSKSNHPANLRLAGSCGNQQNAWKRKSQTASKYKGVSANKNKSRWCAAICANGSKVYLGTYDTEELAALAYNNAAQKLHGEFAFLNPVQPELR